MHNAQPSDAGLASFFESLLYQCFVMCWSSAVLLFGNVNVVQITLVSVGQGGGRWSSKSGQSISMAGDMDGAASPSCCSS